MRDNLRRLLRLLYGGEALVAGLALGLVAAALFVDIAGREVLGRGVFGAQRAAVYGMIVSAMLGLALSVQRGRHIRIEGLDWVVPAALQPSAARLGHAVSAAICLYLVYWSADFAYIAFEQGERGMALDILVWPIKLILPWAFGSAALRYLLFALDPALEEPPEGAG